MVPPPGAEAFKMSDNSDTLHWIWTPTIVSAGVSSETAQFAASELGRYLAQILLSAEAAPSLSPKQTIHLTVEKETGLSDEGFSWRMQDGELHIAAGGDLGLVFGVYAFLRDVCGCRFCGLGPEGEFVPRLGELHLNVVPTRREPKLWYRSIQFYYFEHPAQYQRVIDWMAKNGFNYLLYHLGSEEDAAVLKEQRDPATGEMLFPESRGFSMFGENYFDRYLLPEIRKRGLKLDFNHHNFCYWLPPARHAREHPEWYAEIDGKRAVTFTQFCLCTSNREVVGELIRRVKDFLRTHPEVRIVGVVPEDGRGMCQCDACRAMDVDPNDAFTMDRDYRDPANENRSLVRRYALLLNEVARAVREEFPGVLVSGLAYIDLQWPPRDVRFEDNITFQVAVYWRDGARPLQPDAPSRMNRFYFDLLEKWRGKLRGPLLLYEYYMGMQAQRNLPYPMPRVIAEDWLELARIPVEGATIQCTAGCFESYLLNLLAFSKCAWGETVDTNQLLSDYVVSVFGSVGHILRPIFQEWLDAADALRDGSAASSEFNPMERADNALLPDGKNVAYFWERLGSSRAWDLIDRAAKAATSERERTQIDRFARYLKYCELAAQAMATQLRADRAETEAPEEAHALRVRLVERDLPAVVDYLKRTKLPGWVLPRTFKRWQSDLNRLRLQISPLEQPLLCNRQ